MSEHARTLQVFGRDVQVVTLRQLVHLKRAAGRPKDLEAIAELVALDEEKRRAEQRRPRRTLGRTGVISLP